MQFVINVPEMPADCSICETEPGGDQLVREPRSEQFKDFTFTLRKTFDFRGNGHRFLERKNNLAGDFPRHRSASLANLANRGNEFFRGGAFQQITGGAGAQGLENAFGVFIDRDYDDLNRGHQLLEPGSAFDAGNFG